MNRDWDLDASLRVTDASVAGGLLQDGTETTPMVHLEVSGHRTGDGEPVTQQLIMDLDVYFALMARLEHAGKVALMMPGASDVSAG